MDVLQNRDEIGAAQASFQAAFRNIPHQVLHTSIGYRGGNYETEVMWVPSLGIWGFFGDPPNEKSPGERFWNPFGLGKPPSQASIVCEINPPKQGVNPATGAIFLRGPGASITVAHRGKFTVSGGMKIAFFQSNFRGRVLSVFQGHRTVPLFRVAELQSDGFGEDLALFVNEVHRIKELKRK